MFHNEKEETLSHSEITALQNERLKKIVNWVYTHNDVFKQRFDEANVNPDTFRGLDDLTALPTMNKKEFREYFPLGMCCVPKDQIREMHQSSGTSGTPVVMPYTNNDIHQW